MKCSDSPKVTFTLHGRRLRRPFIFILFLFLSSLFPSCQTPQEKKGASAIPVNRPASWENDGMTGGTR
jgi:hypothetical protein